MVDDGEGRGVGGWRRRWKGRMGGKVEGNCGRRGKGKGYVFEVAKDDANSRCRWSVFVICCHHFLKAFNEPTNQLTNRLN